MKQIDYKLNKMLQQRKKRRRRFRLKRKLKRIRRRKKRMKLQRNLKQSKKKNYVKKKLSMMLIFKDNSNNTNSISKKLNKTMNFY
jgi:hypothetical protein